LILLGILAIDAALLTQTFVDQEDLPTTPALISAPTADSPPTSQTDSYSSSRDYQAPEPAEKEMPPELQGEQPGPENGEIKPAQPQITLLVPKHMPLDRKIYTVKKGDTLWDISRRFTGTPYNYPEVARVNEIENPDIIYPKQRILLKRAKDSQQRQ
jgi:nucleoid-associated protein YgaU